MWSDTANSDPITDVMNAQDAVEALQQVQDLHLLVSKQTMNWLKQNVKVPSYTLAQNVTATYYDDGKSSEKHSQQNLVS